MQNWPLNGLQLVQVHIDRLGRVGRLQTRSGYLSDPNNWNHRRAVYARKHLKEHDANSPALRMPTVGAGHAPFHHRHPKLPAIRTGRAFRLIQVHHLCTRIFL